LIERGTSAADPLDAMAERALADVKPFALRQIIGCERRDLILMRACKSKHSNKNHRKHAQS
jgi:hypothetical protein